MADETNGTLVRTDNPDLKELREEFAYATDEKRDIRQAGAEDMRAVAGDVWDPDERRARDDANRICLSLDELGQYVNQAINDVRQNKRSIRVAQQGRGATDKTAEFRQNLIRQIEYRSNAQSAAYSVMYENTIQRSYGYLRITPEYVNYRSNDQELRIIGIPNPDMVTEDPAALRTDGADWKFLYFTEMWTRTAFRQKFPNARVVSFDDAKRLPRASDWVNARGVMVGERWRIVTKRRDLYLVVPPPVPSDPVRGPQPAAQPQFLFKDELADALAKLPEGTKTQQLRTVDYPYVKKQITNGLEILEETDFPGTAIPFISCYGKVLYLEESGVPKKKILSLVRLARDPLMLYCYYRTQQAEMAGMIPKVPVVGYKGQFSGVENDWHRAPHEPLAFIEALPTVDGVPAGQLLPLPSRLAYDAGAQLQALELCAEGARRAIQAAIGATGLPTEAQRHNQKSGIALQKIDDNAQRGSFHFVDHYDDAINRAGTILDELIPSYYDTARDVTTRNGKDQPTVIRINDPQHPQAISATDGDHDVTISVGPRESSEREAASDFADLLVGSPQILQVIGPEKAAQVVALAIQLKSVGPIGDEIAQIIAPKPPEDGQPPSPQQVQMLQEQLQALTQQLQQAQHIIEGKQIEAQEKSKLQFQIEQLKAEMEVKLANINNAAKIEIARIMAAKEASNIAQEAREERLSTGLELDHTAAEAEKDRAHDVGLAAMAHTHGSQAADQAHGQAIEQGALAHANTLDQQAAAAASQPAPDDGPAAS